jgi:hypothetical protein
MNNSNAIVENPTPLPPYEIGLLTNLLRDLEGENRLLFMDEIRTLLAREIANSIFINGGKDKDLLATELDRLKHVVELLVSTGDPGVIPD